MEFPALALERLAHRILQGDVVFFIGSGFSIDSEKTSGGRLLRRLLIRLLALTKVLGEDGSAVRRDFIQTFELKADAKAEFPFLKEDLQYLGLRYYEVNDWFCDAFTHLFGLVAISPDGLRTLFLAHEQEEAIRQSMPEDWQDDMAFDEIDPLLLEICRSEQGHFAKEAGKALFLDTVGFRHPGIMGGRPRKDVSLREVEASYHGRLLPRHQVLARLAREGLSGSIITTNFDLLLEGAFRLSGFPGESERREFPATLINDFETVASPVEFFTKGKAYRTAVVVKMHGCAQRYRDLFPAAGNGRAPADIAAQASRVRAYLRSIVYTYREIQNWRTDSWAADYLRTLLRTRVVVFCGYSVADPVVHDTFRSVYEEMARARSETARDAQPDTADAPAYFFAASPSEEKREFYGMEVLQSASAAVGAERAEFAKHPNYIRCRYRGADAFPDYDALFRWLFHLTFRLRQAECLKSDLRRMVTLLVGRGHPDKELEAVRSAWEAQFKTESEQPGQWREEATGRREHAKLCGWTDIFHVGLLREFACAEVVRRRQGPGVELGLMRRFAWYYPAMQNAGWTCWGAVVEVALRRMAETIGATVRVAECRRPTLLVYPSKSVRHTPHALTIHFGGFERSGVMARVTGHPARRLFWELSAADAPWPRRLPQNEATPASPPFQALGGAGSRPARGQNSAAPFREFMAAPQAEILWHWACGRMEGNAIREARALLGLAE